MIDKKKIRLMTKLAVYDKKYGEKDKRISEKFKWDYIYIKNFWTRLGVLASFVILTFFYIFNKILVEQTNFINIDYRGEASKIIVVLALALAGYTVLNSYIASKEYKNALRRIERYYKLIDKLEEMTDSNYIIDNNLNMNKNNEANNTNIDSNRNL